MNIEKKPRLHLLILMGAFISALVLRLTRLGSIPLSNLEASISLQALAASQRAETLFDTHIGYVGLTGLDFLIFEPGNFLARFWPAFLGACVVFIPFLFRDQMGPWPASILSIALAVSPEMVGLSRMIGSPMMAFVGFFLGLGLINYKKPILAGIAFALGLMSGPGFWTGVLVIGLSVLLFKVIFKSEFEFFPADFLKNNKDFWLRLCVSFALVLFLVGTVFFLAPEGLNGVFAGLVAFIHGFSQPYIKPFWLKPLALLAFGLSALVFGFWGGIRGVLAGNIIDLFLLLWAVLGCAALMLYPAALPADILWVTLPLWALAARVIFLQWKLPQDNHLILAVTAVTVVIIFAFVLLALRSLISPTLDQQARVATLIAILGGLVLLFAVVFLVSYGWSGEAALSGLLIGLVCVSLFGMLSLSFRTTGLGSDNANEVWYPGEERLSPRWLMVTVERVLDWNKRRTEPVDISVVGVDSPGLRWVLRDNDDTAFISYLPPASQPGIVISDIDTQPENANSYRGQDLVWSSSALWEQMSPFQYLEWLIKHTVPADRDSIIIWVRTDLMPDGQLIP